MSTLSKQTTRPSLSATAAKGAPKPQQTFLFNKENYMWMIGGIVLLLIGFLLLSGGKSANPNEFHAEELYSFRRITLAPIVLMLGFAVEVYAIMKKPKESTEVTTTE
jgi:membrane-bound ClpP family serine protease